MISGLFAESGRRSRISPPFRFANLHQGRLHQGVIIHRVCWIHVVSDTDVKLAIGPDSSIGLGVTISAAESVAWGDHVLLARNV
jgi:hypothetical protein